MSSRRDTKILAIRVGRAGDMVMITPALREIFAKHAHAEIHVLTSADGRRVLRGFDARISRLLIYRRRGLGTPFQRWRLRREIAAADYDVIYCFETNPSFQRLFAGTRARTHVLRPSAELAHFSERCLQLVRGAERGPPAWVRLPVTDAGKQAAQRMLAAAGIDGETFVIGFHPSFSGLRKSFVRSLQHRRQKAWSPESFGRLAELLDAYARTVDARLRIVMDLLPDERPLGESIVAASGGRIALFTEPPDFERYKATLARMNLLVTPDTGPMHIAAAVGTPLVALFCGSDPRDCGPYVPSNRFAVLRAEDTAAPQRGLAAISPESVFEACRRFLPR